MDFLDRLDFGALKDLCSRLAVLMVSSPNSIGQVCPVFRPPVSSSGGCTHVCSVFGYPSAIVYLTASPSLSRNCRAEKFLDPSGAA